MSLNPCVRIKVPASSANLGPGFDCLGLALALSTTFELEILSAPAPLKITATSTWDPGLPVSTSCLPAGEDNLFYRAFAAQLEHRAVPLPAGVAVHMTLGLPPGRGLGSSATAVVGGILAAEAYVEAYVAGDGPSLVVPPLDAARRRELVSAAVELEPGRHADNVAAALLGGLVVASPDERAQAVNGDPRRWEIVQLPVPVGLRAVLFVPEIPMDTVVGRALLPSVYSRADAVHNIGHAALLVAALAQGDLAAVGAAMDDRCHEPYRAQLFPQLPQLLAAARRAGAYGVCLSGGGSAILALAERMDASQVARALTQTARACDVAGRAIVVGIDRRGAQVRVGASPTLRPSLGGSRTRITQPQVSQELACPSCRTRFPLQRLDYRCDCGQPLEADLGPPDADVSGPAWRRLLDGRLGSSSRLDRSGVWRFRELLLPGLAERLLPISRPEGETNCYPAGREQDAGGHGAVGRLVGLDRLWLKHEGENPTGSFKDRGMTVAVTIASWLGATAVACASTGNTSASLAAYAAQAGLPAVVLLPEGKVAYGKLCQALAYGAEIRRIPGDFDRAMAAVEELCRSQGCHLLNSLNPFRLIGQQSLALEILQQLRWDVPDWVVLPAGNLGNTSALGLGFLLAKRVGLVDRVPRIAAVQASGANPFYQSYRRGFAGLLEPVTAKTVASAISIGNPVSFDRARRVIEATSGVVVEVTDDEIMEAKYVVDRAGIGCEPASAASIAGLCRLVHDDVVRASDSVVAVLTGNLLKDPYSVRVTLEEEIEDPDWGSKSDQLARKEQNERQLPCWS